MSEDQQLQSFFDVLVARHPEHILARRYVGFPLQLIECRVEQAQGIHIGIGETRDRACEIKRMPTLVNECSLAAALPAGVDRFLGDSDVDLVKSFCKTKPFILDAIVRIAGVDQTGDTRRVDLADRSYAHAHFRIEY